MLKKIKMAKKGDKICVECQKEINLSDDKHVLLGTYSGEKIDDESYFHFKCFVKWYNQKVSEKAKNSVSSMQNKVQGLMANPQIAGILSQFGGADKLKGMLNLDLGSGEIPSLEDLFKEEEKPNKNDDGKPKPKKSTKKKV